MTRAATVFLMSLTNRTTYDHPSFLAAGNSADELAREFREGLPALRAALETEAGAAEHTLTFPGLYNLLREVWTRRGDDQHLTNATGHNRQWWLDAPIWDIAS